MKNPPDTLEAGRSGPWCETGSRTYSGKPFDRRELIRKAANTRLSIRLCSQADDSHAKSLRQYAHTWHDHKNPGQICVAEAFLDLPKETRDGLIAHEIGHILAGPTSSEPAADEAFRVFTGIRILYRDSDHGSCLQWLPKKFGKLLEGLLEIDLSKIAGTKTVRKNGPRARNPLVDSDVLAQKLYDAMPFPAVEIPLAKVNMSTSDRGHPVVDEPERYRFFLIPKFPVQAFGLRVEDVTRDGDHVFYDDLHRHNEIVKLLRAGSAWPAIVTADGVLVDGFHRVAANRTVGNKTMPVIVAVERSGRDHWDDMWLGDDADAALKKNGDELLRRLEREAKSGDPEAIERLKKERARRYPTIRERFSEAPLGVTFRFATEVDGVLDAHRPLPGPWRKVTSDWYRYVGSNEARSTTGYSLQANFESGHLPDLSPDDPEIVWEPGEINESHMKQRRAAERRKTSKTTFKKIPIGGIFVFASRYDDAFAMPLGPWEKTSPRGYMRVDPEYYSLPNGGRSKRRVKHQVGMTSVEVYPEDLQENPMKKNGDELLRRMETGRGGFGTWEIIRERARRGLPLAPTVLKNQWVRNPWARSGAIHEDYNAPATVVLLPPGISMEGADVDWAKNDRRIPTWLSNATGVAVLVAHPHKADAARAAAGNDHGFGRLIMVPVSKEFPPDRWHSTESAIVLDEDVYDVQGAIDSLSRHIENATRAKIDVMANPPKDPRGLNPGGAGILFMSDDAVFLIQRSRRVPSPGTWCIPGGKIEPGEDPFDAALRETKEEVGENLPPFEINERIDVRHDDGFVFSTFVARVRQRDAALWITRPNWECDDSGWFLLNRLPSPLHQGVSSLLKTCPDLWTPQRSTRPSRR